MTQIDIALLSFVLIFLNTVLKVFIGRACNIPTIIIAFCELPVSIISLAISLSVTFIAAYKVQNSSYGLFHFLIGMVIFILVILIWRYSLDLFSRGKITILILSLFINFSVSGWGLREAINLFPKKEQQDVKGNQNRIIKKSEK